MYSNPQGRCNPRMPAFERKITIRFSSTCFSGNDTGDTTCYKRPFSISLLLDHRKCFEGVLREACLNIEWRWWWWRRRRRRRRGRRRRISRSTFSWENSCDSYPEKYGESDCKPLENIQRLPSRDRKTRHHFCLREKLHCVCRLIHRYG